MPRDAHEAVSALKDLALELGRCPTRAEFTSRFAGMNTLLANLGGFSPLVKMAGLETYDERRTGRAPGRVERPNPFLRDLSGHLAAHDEPRLVPREPYPSLAAISDVHWPFASERVLDRFVAYVAQARPEHVVLVGDAWDMYSFAKFPRSHNVFTPRDEMRLAREGNESFWRRIRLASPESKLTQMLGNHDVRPLKRIVELLPSAEDWIAKALTEQFTFDGVRTIFDAREELTLNGVTIHHGYASRLGAHRDEFLTDFICGHTHRGGVVFRQIRGRVLFEANCGLAGDPTGKGLTYTPTRSVVWTPGFVTCDAFGPRFIPA